jgi:hypothetical protein
MVSFPWRHLKKAVRAVKGRRQIFCYGRAIGGTRYVWIAQAVFKKTYKVLESFNTRLGAVYRSLLLRMPPVSAHITDMNALWGTTNQSVLSNGWNLNPTAIKGLTNHEKQRYAYFRNVKIWKISNVFILFNF